MILLEVIWKDIRSRLRPFSAVILLGAATPAIVFCQAREKIEIGQLNGGAVMTAVRDGRTWGLSLEGAGMASASQATPVHLELFTPPESVAEIQASYDQVRLEGKGCVATAHVSLDGPASLEVRDTWSVEGNVIHLARAIEVRGSSSQGFLSSISFQHKPPHPRTEVKYFAPGMIYGGAEHLSPASIGGAEQYEPGKHGDVQIREDRLPAPMFGVWFPDGTSLTLLDPKPDGSTTKADAHDLEARPMIDARFRFGAIGVHLDEGQHEQGFWFPGSEGEVTYKGNTYPGGQMRKWRRRYHPIEDGLTQKYQVAFRVGSGNAFPDYMRESWRWAWQILDAPVLPQDLNSLRQNIMDVLASQVISFGGRTGVPIFVSATPAANPAPALKACMGFAGKQIESAEMLLADSEWDKDQARAGRYRELGDAMIASSMRMRIDPPIADCFDLLTGNPVLSDPPTGRIFLRAFSDDFKSLLRAYRRERLAGRLHPEWLDWVKRFADWLLTQQQSGGGFPRAWHPGSGEVVDASPLSSYNAVPFLALLTGETHDPRYLQAAEKAAEFVWSHGQSDGVFVGGTIDNPDVLDKEAGTLSIEAYSALYRATGDLKWLRRAAAAGDYAETYIYLWNVPMPADDDDLLLHWKKSVPTIGTQLIATGHSLVDEFMAFNVPEYAELAQWTGDPHYRSVAALLLHDTKGMTAESGRAFDLNGPGWQQEHWSFAPVRGFGLHRGWLPWVATSQLVGVVGLEELAPAANRALETSAASPAPQ